MGGNVYERKGAFEPHPLDPLVEQIKQCVSNVRDVLSQGYQEVIYQKALLYELRQAGLKAEAEVPLQVGYKGIILGDFVADIVVENQIIIELKAVQTVVTAHEVQLVNYLKATGIEMGLLINFGQHPVFFKRKFRDYIYR